MSDTCPHKVKRTERSVQYERAKGIRRREYACVLCDEKLPATYEGTIDDLIAWLAPQIRTGAFRDAIMAINHLN